MLSHVSIDDSFLDQEVIHETQELEYDDASGDEIPNSNPSKTDENDWEMIWNEWTPWTECIPCSGEKRVRHRFCSNTKSGCEYQLSTNEVNLSKYAVMTGLPAKSIMN